MQPHQERVITEKDELDKKINSLSSFIGQNAVFQSLDEAEKGRLETQLVVMREYSDILGERIENFGR